MYNPTSLPLYTQILKGVTHVMIVACYHPLPFSACMLYFLALQSLHPQHFSKNVYMYNIHERHVHSTLAKQENLETHVYTIYYYYACTVCAKKPQQLLPQHYPTTKSK